MRVRLTIMAFILFSCGSKEKKLPNIISEASVKDSVVSKDSVTFKKPSEHKKNIYDNNHYKQGVWDIVKNGKIKGFQTFKNDTLNGPSEWLDYPGSIKLEYLKGVEHGLRKYYHVDKTLNMVVKFEMGKKIWAAFPSADSRFPKPVKGFHTDSGSVYIECPYSNDTIWYKGHYLNDKPVGIHKMFYENGKPKFEYNYANKKIKVFDTNGNFIKEVKDDGVMATLLNLAR